MCGHPDIEMALPRTRSVGLLLAMALLAPAPAAARQEPCRAPAPPVSSEPNIFTETQENDLGDAVADHRYRQVRLIDDDALTARLKAVGAALLGHLPCLGSGVPAGAHVR